jgi:hypothetical protein
VYQGEKSHKRRFSAFVVDRRKAKALGIGPFLYAASLHNYRYSIFPTLFVLLSMENDFYFPLLTVSGDVDENVDMTTEELMGKKPCQTSAIGV